MERLNWEEGHGESEREERGREVMDTVSITAGHLGLNPAGSPEKHTEQPSKDLQAFSMFHLQWGESSLGDEFSSVVWQQWGSEEAW